MYVYVNHMRVLDYIFFFGKPLSNQGPSGMSDLEELHGYGRDWTIWDVNIVNATLLLIFQRLQLAEEPFFFNSTTLQETCGDDRYKSYIYSKLVGHKDIVLDFPVTWKST